MPNSKDSDKGSRPYPCEVPGCMYAAKTASALKSHMRTHNRGPVTVKAPKAPKEPKAKTVKAPKEKTVKAVKAPKEKTVKTVKAPKEKAVKAAKTVKAAKANSPVLVRESARMRGTVVLFTGFRSKELERAVLSHGASLADNFNKSVTLLVTKDASVDNAKTQKAASMGVKVVTAEQLKAMV